MGSAAVQGHLWGRAAHDWAELQEPTAAPLWDAMLAAAAVGPGTHLLDAGCGAGGASVLAARRGALVNGLDAAEALLAIARSRLPEGDFRLGDVEDLPYADATFEAVIVADVLPYVTDPRAAVRELRRVCAPAGRVVVAVWGPPEECAQHAILSAIRDLLPAPFAADLFALSAPSVLDRLLEEAGLAALGGHTMRCRAVYGDREMAWTAVASSGMLQAALRLVGSPPLRAVVLRALEPYEGDNGSISLTQSYRYVAAQPAERRTS